MSDSAASVLLLAALLAAPIGASLVRPQFLWLFPFFGIAGVLRFDTKWAGKLLLTASAPLVAGVVGLITGRSELFTGSLRWAAGLAGGVYFAGELGSGRIINFLSRASRRAGPFRHLLETMVLMALWAGPCSARAKTAYRQSRDEGMKAIDALEAAVYAAARAVESPAGRSVETVGPIPMLAGILAWGLLLAGISGI